MTIHDVVQNVLTSYLIGDTSLDEGGEDEGGETRGVIAPLLAPLQVGTEHLADLPHIRYVQWEHRQ